MLSAERRVVPAYEAKFIESQELIEKENSDDVVA